jgi:predicted ATP-binding protein involved in virulence
MHITELELINFRQFKQLKLHFPPKLAVFIGDNGSGKSTILDALALLMQNFTATEITTFERSDININANKATISINHTLFGSNKLSLTKSHKEETERLPIFFYFKAFRLLPKFPPHYSSFDAMRIAIENFMEAMQIVYFSNYSYICSSNIHIEKSGNKLDIISQLSDGERFTMLMVANIAHQLSQSNPNSNAPLLGEGVVLIDDIDTHLHPKWQRRIIPALNSTFPNLQFIVTTHSPQVISTVSSSNVFLLENGEVFSVEATKGRDSNDILDTVMNANDSPIQKLMKELAIYINANNFERAERLLNSLMQEVEGDYAPLLRYKALIEHKKNASSVKMTD